MWYPIRIPLSKDQDIFSRLLWLLSAGGNTMHAGVCWYITAFFCFCFWFDVFVCVGVILFGFLCVCLISCYGVI